VFAQGAIRSDFEIGFNNAVGDFVEFEHLDAGLIAEDFLGILEAFAFEGDFDFGTTLTPGGSNGAQLRRGSVCERGQEKGGERDQNPKTEN
jgi:hypothetical protein